MSGLRMLPVSQQDWRVGLPAGSILRAEHDGVQHLYVCPCGCGTIWHAKHAVKSGSVETGDLTLTPSLVCSYTSEKGVTTGCGWHGWLVDGVFTSVDTPAKVQP